MHLKIGVVIFIQVRGLFKIVWQNVLYLGQNQAEMSAFFFCGKFLSVLLDTTVSRKDGFSRTCSHVFRLVRHGEVRFKLRADFEFLLAEKELVTKIPRLLKMYTFSVLLIKALIVVGLYQLQVLGKALCDASQFQPQAKTQSVEWHLPNSPQNKFKATPATGKIMATVFRFLECKMHSFGRHYALGSNC